MQPNLTLFIDNRYQKYKGKLAYRVRDEAKFIERIYEEIEDNKYFLFGSDSNDTATKIYNKCLSKYPDKLDKFILITADTNFKLKNASEQFKDKFVFYSPKITYGIDFNITTKQNVFIYIKGRTLSPYGTFQQCTRTRNIDSIYFYCECYNKDENYQSLEILQDNLKENLSHSILKNVCLSLDDEDEFRFLENTFFKLYSYNEFVDDIFNTGKYYHFENIITQEGFELVNLHEPKKLDKDTRDELTELIEAISLEQFNEYLNSNDKDNVKYDTINKRISLLNLSKGNNEQLTSYRDIIMSKWKLNEHLNIIKLLKTDEYLKARLATLKETSLSASLLKYTEYKMVLVREFEKYYGMNPLEVEAFDDMDDFKLLDKQFFNIIKRAFETKKEEPKDRIEAQRLYIAMLKHLTDKEIITSTRKKNRGEGRDGYSYSLNDNFIKYHIVLNSFSNINYKSYDETIN